MNLGETASFSALWASHVMPSIICQHKKKKLRKKALDPLGGGTLGVALAKVQVEHSLDNQRGYVMSFSSIHGFQK